MKSLREKLVIADHLISSERLRGILRSDEERCIEAGFKDLNEYLDSRLSSVMPASSFVRFLASFFFEPSLKRPDHQHELNCALFDAYESGEQWFIPALDSDYSRQRVILCELRERFDQGKDVWALRTLEREIKLRPREAVEWLLTTPEVAHLVTGSLRDFLMPTQVATDASVKRQQGGRPPAADLDALELAIENECKQRGCVPRDMEGPKGWQTQEDVIRWALTWLTDRGTPLGHTQAKTHVSRILHRISQKARN
ncbi:MAG: hypothetical protein AB1508_16795 [Pseudomonadota bacterium]